MVCVPKREAQRKRWNNRKDTKAAAFRRSYEWTEKSLSVRARDHYRCLCCKAKLIGTVHEIETHDLSVHHITPIKEAYDLRLDESNLITVCEIHHELCESGDIPRDVQRSLVEREIRARDRESGRVF